MRLSKEEKAELKRLAKSIGFKKDIERVAKARHNPFVTNGEVNLERLVAFLTEYNQFINHIPRPFRKIIDRDMRL